MVVVNKSEFKGNAIIELKERDEGTYAFRFGITKAKLILDAIDEIKKFVEENEKKGGEKTK